MMTTIYSRLISVDQDYAVYALAYEDEIEIVRISVYDIPALW